MSAPSLPIDAQCPRLVFSMDKQGSLVPQSSQVTSHTLPRGKALASPTALTEPSIWPLSIP